MTVSIIRTGLLILWLAASLFSASADQVIFKNGRSLDCRIIAEHEDHVEVSLGAGSMNISLSQVERLVRSEPSQQQADQSAWQEGNILHEQFAPPAYAGLAADFRQLMQQRNAAMDAIYMLNHYDKEINKLEREGEELGRQVTELNRQLTEKSQQAAAIKLPDEVRRHPNAVRAYNRVLLQKNKLTDEANAIFSQIGPLEAQRQALYAQIPKLNAKSKAHKPPIATYRTTLKKFRKTYAEQQAALPPEPAAPVSALFDKMDRLMRQFNEELSICNVEVKQVGNTTLVEALINGTTTGQFVLDTGASSMTVSESFARQLGIDPEGLPNMMMIVADGSTTQVKRGQLQSVEVGEAVVKNVDILVVPDSPNMPMDGLLGMTFLKHFSVQLHGTGELELTRFAPRN